METSSVDPESTRQKPPRGSLLQQIHAYILNLSRSTYELASTSRKRALFSDLHGDILGIGPGDGLILAFSPPDVHWLEVEPNPYMHLYIRQKIGELGRDAGNYRIDFGDSEGVRLRRLSPVWRSKKYERFYHGR